MTALVSDLMQRKVVSVAPDTPLSEVVSVLADQHISGLPVVDHDGRLLGVISSSDVLIAEAEADSPGDRVLLLEEALASDLMTPRPITIPADAPARQAAQEMLYAEVHRLFVEEEGRLVGVISQTDLVRAVAGGKL
jgi:CBS domain-containing protein